MNRIKNRICSLLLGPVLIGSMLACPPDATAGQIYHWVDENGVQHFSQTAPREASNEVKTLDVDGSQPASYDPEEDRYNVAAQAEAMQALRDEMAESRKNRQQAQPASAETTVIYYPQTESYDQILYPPGGYRPRPPRPDKPDRPDNRPPEEDDSSRPFRPPSSNGNSSRPFRPG